MPIPLEKFVRVPLFDGMTPEEIRNLLRIAEYVEVEAGDVIVSQGECGDGFYVIAAGAFEVVKSGDSGPTVLARLEELSFFGEMSLVGDQPRSASVVCVESGRLKKIPVAPFRRMLDEGDRSAYKVVLNMSRVLADRLARIEDELVHAHDHGYVSE